MKIQLLAFFFCLMYTPTKAQFTEFSLVKIDSLGERDSSRIFTDVQLKEDWRIVRKALTDAHPAVYRYTNKENFNQFFDSVNASLTQSMTETEFVKLLMLGVAKVRCIHTVPGFSEIYYKNRPMETTKMLPLNFKYIDGEAYIKKNTSRDSITNMLGLKVNTINGVSMKSYIEEFYPLLPSDGFIKTSRYDLLGNNFNDFYCYFIGRPDTFYLNCDNTLTKDKIELKIAAITIKELLARKKWRNRNKTPLAYKIVDSKTAYLQMNSFDIYFLKKQNQNPYKFLKASFKNIREQKMENLIIDIRNNGGGHGRLAARLFSYITDSSFIPDRSQVMKIIRADNEYLQYKAKDGQSKINPRHAAKTDSGYYSISNRYTKTLGIWKPTKKPFKGNIYLLVSGSTCSAASHFAAIFNTHNRGPIVGQETGGQSYGPNGCWGLNIILPATKARISIPSVSSHHYVKSYVFGQGIMPTYEVDNNERIQSLLDGSDPEMDFTLKLISKEKK